MFNLLTALFGKQNPVRDAAALERTHASSALAGESIAPAGYNNLAHVYYAAFHQADASLRAARQNVGALLLIVAGLVVALAMLLPLKRVETRFIEVETSTGRAVLTKGPPTNVAEIPERLMRNMQNYQLRGFVKALVSLDSQTIKERIPFAASMLEGAKAAKLFDEYVSKIEKIPEKIANNPALTREFAPRGDVAYSADGKQAFVRFDRIEKVNGAEQNVTRMLATIEFAVLPEEPGKEKDNNPIGLRVLYFTISLDQ